MKFYLKLLLSLVLIHASLSYSQTKVKLNGTTFSQPDLPSFNLQARTINGSRVTSLFGGFNNALTDCLGTTSPCNVLIDPNSTETLNIPEFLSTGDGIGARSFRYPDGLVVHDQRPGQDLHFSNNPGAARWSHYFATRQDATYATAQRTQANLMSPMYCAGFSTYHYGEESNCHNLYLYSLFADAGIDQTISVVHKKPGIGDGVGEYIYANSWGGAINGDDEGANAISAQMWDGDLNGFVPTATIVGPGAGAGSYTLANVNMNDSIGAGRYAVRGKTAAGNDAKVRSITVTGTPYGWAWPSGFGTLTVAETVPVSAAWGLSSAFTVPYSNNVPQTVAVTVPSVSGGGPGFVPGIACSLGGNRTERVKILSVTGPATGPQTLQMLIRQNSRGDANANPAWFFQDANPTAPPSGFCQTVGRYVATDGGIGHTSVDIPLIGATDPHTVVYSANNHVGQGAIPGYDQVTPVAPVTVTLNRSNNVVTVVGGNLAAANGHTDFTITGATDASFNITNATAKAVDIFGNVSYPQNGPDGTATGTASIGVGRNVMNVYQAAEILSTANNSAATDRDGSYIALEPNTIPFAAGEKVDFPEHYSSLLRHSFETLHTSIPSDNANDTGKFFRYDGAAIDVHFNARTESNANPFSMYLRHGGFMSPPTWVDVQGPHGNYENFESPTYGGFIQTIGCAGRDCTNPLAAQLYLRGIAINNGDVKEIFDQLHGGYCYSFTNGPCSLQITAAGIQAPQIVAPVGTPSSSSAPCTRGQIETDDSYSYACTSAGWKRAALTAF